MSTPDHTTRAHSRLSASGSHRWMECPASVALEAPFPNTTSEHAAEGTAAHELAEALLRGEVPAIQDQRIIVTDMGYDVDEMVKNLTPYVNHVRSLQGAKFFEMRVSLEALNPPTEMFGTVDAVAWNAGTGHLEIVDLKYGQGVVVEPEGNPQLLYYLLGTVLQLKTKPETMRVTIVQPRAHHDAGPVRSADVTWEDLKDFKARLMARAADTQNPDAEPTVGDHCRWCKAKAVCPAQRNHAIALAQTEFDAPGAVPTLPDPGTLDDNHLALVLERGKLVEDWLKAVRSHAQDILAQGGEVPGWKLVEGRRSRAWRDDHEAEAWLRQRYKVSEIFTKKLVSPYQAEKLVSDRPRLEIPDDMIVVNSGAPKLAPADSPKPALNSGEEFPTLSSGDAA